MLPILVPAAVFVWAALALFVFNGVETALAAGGRGERDGGLPFEERAGMAGFAVAGSSIALTLSIVSSTGLWYALLDGRAGWTAAATLTVTLPLVFLFCEALPRVLFRRHSRELLGRLARPLGLAYAPVRGAVGWLAAVLPAPWGRAGFVLSARQTREELERLLAQTEQSGLVGATGRKMLAGILDARQRTVERLMKPVAEIVSCPESATLDVLAATVTQSGFTRIPIWGSSPAQIAGIVHSTDLLAAEPAEPAPQPPQAWFSLLLHEPLRVQPGTTLVDTLHRFQSSRGHMAIVESPPGTAVGLLTIEDVLEAIIGDIADEHDPKEQGIRNLFQDTFLVDALLDIPTLNRRLGLDLPAGEYDTLSGFLLWLFRKIPANGDETSFGGVRFFVTKADGKRVEQAIVKKLKR